MKIGILQAGHTAEDLRPTRGDFDAMFQRLLGGHGFDFVAYDVENMTFPDNVHDADGWLITGSRHGVYEDHAFIPPLEDFVRQVHEADVPLVGICFGHQIIAKALGGQVEKFDKGWAIGRHDYDMPDGTRMALNAWHQDQVLVAPEGATCLASSPFCTNAMLSYGHKAFTVQPHPEFDGPLIHDMIQMRRGTGTYPDDLMQSALSDVDRANDSDRMARMIANFFLTRQTDVHA
ncbi:type 1 glutamine amidotransferase [Jannaschia pohangensis]|uniref:GMP synthase (Glutamine-hydrolysing) n=1 Tax=Jannaschia pohangensis TaxID=390807 RepID=A0A1I3N8S4_9RHOB|nr:type 1 glutamine amidotransferase [Jannaschia pohangensis]SFJ05579.1 GMP synthase (glutamine-hydrolysing) [Jannaschia pohangensis]